MSPAVALEQKNLGHSPRSTVGTVTEIFDYLRILMARLGDTALSRVAIDEVGTQTPDRNHRKGACRCAEGTKSVAACRQSMSLPERPQRTLGNRSAKSGVPTNSNRWPHQVSLDSMRLLWIQENDKPFKLSSIELSISKRPIQSRISDSVEQALSLGVGVLQVGFVGPEDREEQRLENDHPQPAPRLCERCGRSFPTLTPHHFSFNSSVGWCPQCEGLGKQTRYEPRRVDRFAHARRLPKGRRCSGPASNHDVSSQWLLRALDPTDRNPSSTFRLINLTVDSATFVVSWEPGIDWIEVRQSDVQTQFQVQGRSAVPIPVQRDFIRRSKKRRG